MEGNRPRRRRLKAVTYFKNLKGKLVKKALYSLTTALLASFTAVFAGDRVGDFALIDNQGTQPT